MSDREDPPFAGAKINFLVTNRSASRVLGHAANNFRSFTEDYLGVPRKTLLGQMERGRILPKMQAILADKLKFRLDWPEWATGDASAFAQRYMQEHKLFEVPTRRADVRLARGSRQAPTKSQIPGLAAVAIDGAQFGVGTVALELTVSCGMPPILGAYTTIKCGRIELRCSPAVLTKDAMRRWSTSDNRVTGTRGLVNISFEAGSRESPCWRLAAEGSSIGTIVLDPEFAALEDLAPGDEITVQFGTWLSDIEDADASDLESDGIALTRRDGTEIDFSPERLSIRKQRIISCIRKSLLPSDDSGYVVVASHVLKVVDAGG